MHPASAHAIAWALLNIRVRLHVIPSFSSISAALMPVQIDKTGGSISSCEDIKILHTSYDRLHIPSQVAAILTRIRDLSMPASL